MNTAISFLLLHFAHCIFRLYNLIYYKVRLNKQFHICSCFVLFFLFLIAVTLRYSVFSFCILSEPVCQTLVQELKTWLFGHYSHFLCQYSLVHYQQPRLIPWSRPVGTRALLWSATRVSRAMALLIYHHLLSCSLPSLSVCLFAISFTFFLALPVVYCSTASSASSPLTTCPLKNL